LAGRAAAGKHEPCRAASNSLYLELVYRPAEDRVLLLFER
jgi:hypothetical protein